MVRSWPYWPHRFLRPCVCLVETVDHVSAAWHLIYYVCRRPTVLLVNLISNCTAPTWSLLGVFIVPDTSPATVVMCGTNA